jgi:phosphocarrier protein HPr
MRDANTCGPDLPTSWAEREAMDEPQVRRATVKIVNKKGLHARASAKVVEAAARFSSHITVTRDGQSVDARSIMGLMMLAASMGSSVDITCEGADCDEAMVAILALIEAKFGED